MLCEKILEKLGLLGFLKYSLIDSHQASGDSRQGRVEFSLLPLATLTVIGQIGILSHHVLRCLPVSFGDI